MRILACGGRDYADYFRVLETLQPYATEDATVVHGDARGADRLAGNAATRLGMGVEAHPAEWNKYGKAAGHIRNQRMLDTGVDIVIAFPGGRGTADMVRRAESAGVPVEVVA